MDNNLLEQLIAPIPGAHPCGEDASYSTEFDEIREARRQDDASLALGEWETELKTAQWPKVKQLCEQILKTQSKDLQIVCWYTEALTHLQGFAGLNFGLQILEVLLDDFWEFFYPELDPDDLDERVGKIAWFNQQLATVIRQVPLTGKASGGYSWLKWDESRKIENLGLKDPSAKEQAISEGKLSGESFDKSASKSGLSFYQILHSQIQQAQELCSTLAKLVDERFGRDAPSLKELRGAVNDCNDVVHKLLVKFGGKADNTVIKTPAGQANEVEQVANHRSAVHTVAIGHIQSRADAVMALRQAAQFFRHNEPHSPVALLAERAAKWAEMPLEQWLASVIKDDATLGQLRELLDISHEES